MSNSLKVMVTLGLAAFVAACSDRVEEEKAVIVLEEVSVEPTFNSKYK